MTTPESDRAAGRMFDRIVVVDWSANATPKRGRDSIWVAAADATGPTWTLNVATRAQAVEVLARTIAERRDRVLLAVDFSLGFPRGTAAALGLVGDPWAAMWALLADRIVDDARNRNNRFAVAAELNRALGGGPGPFWGCPPAQRSATLTSTKVEPDRLPTWRLTEESLRATGHRPFSSWQLLGAGAVGSQTLLGIAALRTLVRRLARDDGIAAHVWPFTTGLGPPALPAGQCLIAEVWPSMITPSARDLTAMGGRARVRDEAQVIALATTLARLDRARRLDALFAPELSSTLLETNDAIAVADAVVGEEGWVLGAGTPLAVK